MSVERYCCSWSANNFREFIIWQSYHPPFFLDGQYMLVFAFHHKGAYIVGIINKMINVQGLGGANFAERSKIATSNLCENHPWDLKLPY